ncbi:type II secretion system protein GspE [Dryocola clanedunensis]|uniref:type II secretion system protein GspE n=1 Tax=Cedecea sulfonylureivorans TaxID=3051154 RepID=UPI0019264460|nr:type II secretion system protein GspE [Cedecea sulfonylureivorans]
MSTSPQVLALCSQFNAVLLGEEDTRIKIAAAPNPPAQLFEALRFVCDKHIELEIWPAERLEKARHLPDEPQHEELPESSLSIVTLLNETLQKAMDLRASDIHFEPAEQHYRIRLRIDGVLQLQPTLPAHLSAAITARLKVLGNLDIAERRLPQDGQMDMELGGGKASFRISTLPVRHGEKVVLRLLQQTEQPLKPGGLGMSMRDAKLFQSALALPQGIILVTGPTGSGKTVTLYSALNALSKTDTNVCSVEDPVEIPLPGLNQTQVNIKAGLNFQNVLRALLRQDPDVIMIGEIRDAETAEIAIKAAQTGHLVLSTLHTNSTIETVIRLEQMGIARWLLGSALQLVIAQRLIRKLCPHCKRRGTHEHILPQSTWPEPLPDWQAVGCERCYGGYYGRTALFEILPVNNALRVALTRGAQMHELEEIARQHGMVSLFENGCMAVSQELTTLEEVYRVLGVPHG